MAFFRVPSEVRSSCAEQTDSLVLLHEPYNPARTIHHPERPLVLGVCLQVFAALSGSLASRLQFGRNLQCRVGANNRNSAQLNQHLVHGPDGASSNPRWMFRSDQLLPRWSLRLRLTSLTHRLVATLKAS